MSPARLRRFHGSPWVAKKKKGKGSADADAHAAPEDGQLDLNTTAAQMSRTVGKCRDQVQSIVSSLGRVDASLLDPVRVAVGKGTKPTPLHDYATVGVRDNMLVVSAYDSSSVKHIERAIYEAKLDLTPHAAPEEGDGVLVVGVPRPTGETRQRLTAQKQLRHDLDHKIVSKSESQKESKRLEDITKQEAAHVEKIAADAHKRLHA
ncbi:hypothetical protein MSPP1_000865 [Malassezia sp. CBS 17886]|nr:hypothetical protein MSPP1_000865 [Malassezia sp. CBS 17886]